LVSIALGAILAAVILLALSLVIRL
jgi:hypothetical protein